MAISRLGFNIPSNIQDRQRSGQLFFDVLILFVEKICSVTWNSPMGDYQIFD